MFRSTNKSVVKFSVAMVAFLCGSLCTFAQEATKAPVQQGDSYDTLRYTLLVVAGLLVLVIGVLSSVTGVTGKLFYDKQKKEKESLEVKPVIGLLLILFTSFTAFAQDKPTVKEAVVTGPGLPWDIYLFLSVVGLEVIIILFLVKMIYSFLELKKEKALVVKPKKSLLQKITAPVPVEEEARLDLHHDYDGIRELDNNIPRWWQLAFVGTFIFGIIYLYRMFGSGSMPNQAQELAIANDIAEMQKTEYLLHAANNIDENTVKMMGSEGVPSATSLPPLLTTRVATSAPEKFAFMVAPLSMVNLAPFVI